MISILLPVNSPINTNSLKNAVDSVLSQKCSAFELIINNNIKCNNIYAYLQSLEKLDSRIKILNLAGEPKTLSVSQTECLSACSPASQYFVWIFPYNILRSDALSNLLGLARSNLESDFVFGQTASHAVTGEMTTRNFKDSLSQDNNIFLENRMPNAGILVRRNFIESVCWYDNSLILQQFSHQEMLCRMYRVGRFSITDEVIIDEFTNIPSIIDKQHINILNKYCDIRDISGWKINSTTFKYLPEDIIPFGKEGLSWNNDELILIYYLFLKYYFLTDNILKAYEWGVIIRELLPFQTKEIDYLEELCLRSDLTERQIAKLAFAAKIYVRCHQHIQSQSHFAEITADSAENSPVNFLIDRKQFQKSSAKILILEDELRSLRYRAVDRVNNLIKRLPLLHDFLKKMFAR